MKQPPTNSIAAPASTECKICQSSSKLFGVVDFHKSCIEAQGVRLPLSGYPVYYHRCERCAFTFTKAFDTWSHTDFQQNIYNDNYITVDPDFISARPLGNARVVAETFATSRASLRILDYGGGSGLLAQHLCEQQFSAITYDPFSSFDTMPTGRFDLITCFEVMEHVPAPKETVQAMASLLSDNGVILFSTLLQPATFETTGLNWWYASPRNGHVSLYTAQSLAILFKPHGLRVASFSESTHIAYARVPEFATHLKLPR